MHTFPRVRILTTTKTWKRDPALARTLADHLAPDERASTRAALLFLRTRHGGAKKLAFAMGTGLFALQRAYWSNGKPSAGLALRAAKLAGVAVEAILSGAWPPKGACPHCGRSD
jgi:hypothetical protein